MLKATVHHPFRDKSGRKVWAYAVTGTPAEMEAYKAAEGEYFWQDEENGTVFFKRYEMITNRTTGVSTYNIPVKQLTLMITKNNQVVVDDKADAILEGEKIAAGIVGEMTKLIAMQRLGINLLTGQAHALAPAPAPAPQLANEPANDVKSIVDNAVNEAGASGGTGSLEGEVANPAAVAAGATQPTA